MIAVLAHRHDLGARAWVRRHDRTRLVTSEDLARPGWRLGPDPDDAGSAVLDGAPADARAIALVVTVMSRVSPHELFGFHPDDRDYAAAEMTAFLAAWLAALPCAVINRPAPDSLSGPAHSRERWLLLARAHGIPAIELQRSTAAPAPPADGPLHAAVVVGDRCTSTYPDVRRRAVQLARAAQVELLTAHFVLAAGEPRLSAASTVIDLACPATAAALDDRVALHGPP